MSDTIQNISSFAGNEIINSSSGDGVVFVTGASGLVGAHLVQALVQKGEHVKALYRKTIPQYKDVDKVNWIQGDILDISFLEEEIVNVKRVYHCAAIVSYNPKQKKSLLKTNIEGTANIVNACLNAGVEKLVYVSSVSALGRIQKKVNMAGQNFLAKWKCGVELVRA